MFNHPAVLRPAMFISVALVASVLIGCNNDDAAQSESEATDTPTSTAEANLPEPVSPRGAERVDLSDRLLTELTISEEPDWMVSAFGSLWMQQGSGGVVRVDPESGEVIAEVADPGQPGGRPPGGHLCQGIGASEEAVWTCQQEGVIARIDPATNSVAATVRIDKLPDQGRLVSAADRLWVLTDLGAELTGIDPRDNKPATTIPLGGRCSELAAAGTTLWAMCPLEDRLVRIDAETEEISDELALAGATNASVSDHLWVGFEGGVAQIDPETLEVLAVYDLYPRYGGAIFATTDAVWVREEGGPFLTRIDPATRRIVETIEARELPSGGDVVQIGDSVWATAYDDNTQVELRASRP